MNRIARLSFVSTVLVSLLAGVSAFTPSAFGCAGQGGSSCKDAAHAGLDMFALIADLVHAASVWLP